MLVKFRPRITAGAFPRQELFGPEGIQRQARCAPGLLELADGGTLYLAEIADYAPVDPRPASSGCLTDQ